MPELTAAIRIENEISKLQEIYRGVRQGFVTSPNLSPSYT